MKVRKDNRGKSEKGNEKLKWERTRKMKVRKAKRDEC